MRRTLFIIVCCLMAATTTALADSDYTGKVFLQHEGCISQTFNGDEISNAIEAAVDGDTIFLSKGLFKSGFTINKSICLIGSGAEAGQDSRNSTYIEWNGSTSSIKADDNQTISSVTIEGLFSGLGFEINGNIENVTFKKCYFYNTLGFNANIVKANIDRCMICDWLSLYGSIGDMTIKNCKINRMYGNGAQSTSSCKFINCNIYQVDSNTKALFINSIINQVGNNSSEYLTSDAALVSTLYHKLNGYDPMEQTMQQDCWSTTETLINNNSNSLDCSLTAEQLKSAGYLGVDDTVVGTEGGVNPFSLKIHAPSISTTSTNIDLNNQKVTINVNVTAE